MPVYWLIAFVILTGIEVFTLALTTVWFAGGAVAGFVLSLLGLPVEIQLVGFLAVSFLLLFFTRPFAARFVNNSTVKTNVESLVGQTARVIEKIDNHLGMGTAVVGGQEWMARAWAEDEIFEPGTIVVIREIRGVKLIVCGEAEKEH